MGKKDKDDVSKLGIPTDDDPGESQTPAQREW